MTNKEEADAILEQIFDWLLSVDPWTSLPEAPREALTSKVGNYVSRCREERTAALGASEKVKVSGVPYKVRKEDIKYGEGSGHD